MNMPGVVLNKGVYMNHDLDNDVKFVNENYTFLYLINRLNVAKCFFLDFLLIFCTTLAPAPSVY